MSTPLRLGTTASFLALAAALGGCASPAGKQASVLSGSNTNFALATRAQAALAIRDYATAVDLAERAVEQNAKEAEYRTLLGNAYFASGRFASAESAYRDSLSLQADPQVILKLALVQIAQGKNGEARAMLDGSRHVLDPADYGLAVALAGGASEAVVALDQAARQPGADARVRQNLALALGLSGDWSGARTVAAQDVPANQLDARIQQWMAFATPTHASDQVAALVGVTPAASDPGQPTRFALTSADQRTADTTPVDAPVQMADVAAPIAPAVEPVAPLPLAEAAPVVTDVAPDLAPAVAAAEPAPAFVAPKPRKLTASATTKLPPRKAALVKGGKSSAVVQIGAYSSPERVAAAWDKVSKRYGSLRAYQPMSAEFDSKRGTVYRLSVKGFASVREAQALCVSLKHAGGSCFVRSVAGDTPVRIASR